MYIAYACTYVYYVCKLILTQWAHNRIMCERGNKKNVQPSQVMGAYTRTLTCSFQLHYLTRPNDFMPYFEVHIANEVSHFADTIIHSIGQYSGRIVIASHNFVHIPNILKREKERKRENTIEFTNVSNKMVQL